MNHKISIKSADDKNLPIYVSEPKGIRKGAIVIIQEIFGVNNHIKSVANKFADDPELTIRPYFFPKLFDTNFSSFFTFLPSIKDKLSCFKTLITAFISLLSYTALP